MTRIKRLTLDELLQPCSNSEKFVIDQDKKTGKPRVIRKRKDIPSKVCGCGKGQICVRCFVENESETSIENDILEYLNSLSASIAYKTSTKGRSTGKGRAKAKKWEWVGKSDIVWCYKGVFIAIEVKKANGVQSDDQKEFGKRVKSSMGYYFITRSVEDIIKFKNKFYSNEKSNRNNQPSF